MNGKSPEGDTITCHTIVYVSCDVRSLYLSFDTMLNLCILNRDFPKIGHFSKPVENSDEEETKTAHVVSNNQVRIICVADNDYKGICKCQMQQLAPEQPEKLPFP